ncbi:hypothetical protein FACS1894105_12030 [Clostridia bacterium]|nr:hypothetical protein FACS1894105_12030 [Clostridia bacterium]
MIEKIYTIPVNEAWDAKDGCPVCTLYKKLEANELDIILGASMMEPDIRIKTNEAGFCGTHYNMMFTMKNRLGLALMLETHLSENIVPLIKGGAGQSVAKLFNKNAIIDKLDKQHESCYICARIENSLTKMCETSALLFEREREFREKTAAQPYFCMSHYPMLLKTASYSVSAKTLSEYQQALRDVMYAYAAKLKDDVSWFVKKFDYNYENEPWGDAKDAVERAIKFLS